MKKLLMSITFMTVACYGFSQRNEVASNQAAVAVLEWDSQSFDFGKIRQGSPVTHEFRFTNNGSVPLIITNVAASCGCTTPSWSKDPIPVGQTGFVKATFNAGAIGVFEKTVTVSANTDLGFTQLKIKGEVNTQVAQ